MKNLATINRFHIQSLSLLLFLFLHLLTPSQAQQSTQFQWINCSLNKTDAFCNLPANNQLLSQQCCATASVTQKLTPTSSATTSTYYQCLPIEFVKSSSLYAINSTTNITYNCQSTQIPWTEQTTCLDSFDFKCNTTNNVQCCAQKGYQMGTNGPQHVSDKNYCINIPQTSDGSRSIQWTYINMQGTSGSQNLNAYQTVTFAKQCITQWSFAKYLQSLNIAMVLGVVYGNGYIFF
eukprot:403366349